MKVIISKVKNHKHIFGEEFEKVFGKSEIKWAKEEIQEVVDEFERNININGLDLEKDDMEKVEDVSKLKEGFYAFDCGDFNYYIEIEGGLKMISLKNFVDGFMDSKYLDEYLEIEMEKHRDDEGNLRNWDAGRVVNLKEQLKNYLVEVYDSIADIGEELNEEKAVEIYESIIEEKKLQVDYYDEGY